MLGLDTNAIISILRNNKNVLDILAKHNYQCVINDIVLFEILKGIQNKTAQEKHLEQMLLQVNCLSTTKESAYIGAKIWNSLKNSGKEIQEEDCIIAGIYLANNVTKIISNDEHLKRIPGLSIISY